MTALATATSFSLASLESFLESRHEPQWLLEQRRAAWRMFSELDWPDRREEEWTRTDIRLFKLDKYAWPPAVSDATRMPASVLQEGVQLAGASAALDSRPVASHLDSRWAEQGVLFGSLDQMLVDHGERLRPFLQRRIVNPYHDKFAALQAACWSGGHVLFVPRGVAIELPLHVFSALTDDGVDMGRTLVVLEDGAEATVLAETASRSETSGGFHCGATEILMGRGATLRFVNLQDWGHGVWHFAQQRALVGRDATLQWTIAALGSRLSKVNQHVSLVGEGASCQVNGVLFTEGKQHLTYHTLQHHEAQHCRSDFLYKAALQDRSRTVWRGMIKVDPGAQKTDGYQRNDNLLLSDQARADSIPGLEIEADDVRCTHGSTTGNVDEELIFYAMTRGFTRREAVRMIVSGFFQQIFDRITIESVRDALGQAIAARVREYQ